jgi:hypothetical protein
MAAARRSDNASVLLRKLFRKSGGVVIDRMPGTMVDQGPRASSGEGGYTVGYGRIEGIPLRCVQPGYRDAVCDVHVLRL